MERGRSVDDAKTALFLGNRLPFLYFIRKVAFFLLPRDLFPSSYILESLFSHSSSFPLEEREKERAAAIRDAYVSVEKEREWWIRGCSFKTCFLVRISLNSSPRCSFWKQVNSSHELPDLLRSGLNRHNCSNNISSILFFLSSGRGTFRTDNFISDDMALSASDLSILSPAKPRFSVCIPRWDLS